MLRENFEIYLSQMLKNALKLSTMVGENFEIYMSQMSKNALKLSTMVGDAGVQLLHSCLALEVSDHSCTQNAGKISYLLMGFEIPLLLL